jgi:sigma-B regulation protein RsbU (phosphoserine phosphatase)
LRLWFLLLMLVAFGILFFVIWRYARGEKMLRQKTLEEDRMAGELRIANNIQQALLPTPDEPSLAGVSEVSVEGRLIPAKAVGGDLYNAFVRDGKLFFCIGDVSGKGVPAALIMAITQTMFRSIATRESNPAHIISQLNDAACRNNKANVFVTLFVGVLDLPTGHLRYCNAGHEKPFLLAHPSHSSFGEAGGGHLSQIDTIPNLPIGLFPHFNYVMQEMVMPPYSTLFLYTDGLTEAKDEQHALFGRERVRHTLEASSPYPLELVETVTRQVQQFSGNTEPSDDLTLLAISYTPQEEHFILDETLELPNDVKEVTRLSTFIKDVTARLHIGRPLAPKLRLALEEAVVNAMEYAYPAGSKGNILVRTTCDGRRLRFVITDLGVAFNPTEATTADTTLAAQDRPVGGLGILLVRQLMDTINYERTDGKNVLTLTKNIKE